MGIFCLPSKMCARKYHDYLKYFSSKSSLRDYSKIALFNCTSFYLRKIRNVDLEIPDLNTTTLHIQLTNTCNANCTFCAYGKLKTANPHFLSDEVFCKAVSDYVDCGGKVFSLNCTVGDPLLDKDAVNRIRYLREKSPDADIYLYTNLLYLDKYDIDEFLASGLNTLEISTTAFDRDAYQRVYGSSQYDRFLQNITRLLERNTELRSRVKIVIHFRLDVPPWKFYSSSDYLRLKIYLDEISYGMLYNFDSWHGIVKDADMSGSMRISKPCIINYPCRRITNPAIYTNGDVIACACRTPLKGEHPLKIGNIKNNRLNQIWKNAKHNELFHSFFKKDTITEICRDCSFYSPFEGRTGRKELS